MIYAYRTILVRRPVNRFGRLGYAERTEWLKVDSDKKFDEANYRLKYRFRKLDRDDERGINIIRMMRKQPVNSLRYHESNDYWERSGTFEKTWKSQEVKR